MIIVYQIKWNSDWIARETEYEDKYEPFGKGQTKEEALANLMEILETSHFYEEMENA